MCHEEVCHVIQAYRHPIEPIANLACVRLGSLLRARRAAAGRVARCRNTGKWGPRSNNQPGAIPSDTGIPGAPAAALQPAYGQLPLLFVENGGQTNPQVAFTLLGGPSTVFFTPTGVTYALVEPRQADGGAAADRAAADAASPDPAPPGTVPLRRWAVKLDFIGANPDVRPVGLDPAETVVSYFRGRPDEWHTGLRTFQKIVYPDLWPGIDLAYTGAGGAGATSTLKYEFIVHPGADPGRIRLAYRGPETVALNAAGRIEVTTPAGGFTDDLPVAWQEGVGDLYARPGGLPHCGRLGACPERSSRANATTFHLQPCTFNRLRFRRRTLRPDPRPDPRSGRDPLRRLHRRWVVG